MWNHFKQLGNFQKGTRHVQISEQIFHDLKTRIGAGGRFFKKESQSAELYEVDDTVARQSEC